jgi:prepilin-type N-terminal cleavage/methylation domain-containing protein
MSAKTKTKLRRGVSLIEVMVALTLFGLMATVHTMATMYYGVRTRVIELGVTRAASVSTAMELASTMPAASVGTLSGCTTISPSPKFVHTRCYTITALTSTISRVMIVITPSNTSLRPDTVYVDRVTGASTPPFS